ncbi:MAG: 5'/3'-nucleotidase SurE [Candidatus Wallbacteria bacterium]|nr:5'/3'-nucleotidase SurE [Candidatus Wallbacteria bacterium]
MTKRVLLTNDDGIDAPGLASLAMALAASYEVYVLAPDQERSGVGHGFTLFSPLRCDEVPGRFPADLVRKAWKSNGTPVDCVKLALLLMMKDTPPDLVVSGINRGANLAIDTLYSGTVSAAMEAMIMGYPAIACSLATHFEGTATHTHFAGVAEIVSQYIASHEEQLLQMKDYCLNINVPGVPRSELKGARYTRLGKCWYEDRFQVHKDPGGRPYYWIEGSLNIDEQFEDSDVVAVRQKYVSITPLSSDLTSMGQFQKLHGQEPFPGGMEG